MVNDHCTYVAPATTNSTVLALVEPDNIVMKAVTAITMAKIRVVGLVR